VNFRTRLLVTSLLTLVVGLGAVLVVGNVLLSHHVSAETSDLLRGRAEAEEAALAVTRTRVRARETSNDDVLDKEAWVLHAGRVIERPPGAPAALDAAAVALGRKGKRAEAGGPSEFRLLAEPVFAPGGGPEVAAVVVAQSTEALENLQRGVLIGSGALAVLVLLAGFFAIRRGVNGALEPVATITAAAADWGAHDLERRFALGPARDEITELAATLDGLLARIAASRRHEQRFASELAHELRTPLAGLKAQAELALRSDHGTEGAGRAAALEAIVSDAERLERAIDALIAASRDDLARADEQVDLGAIAREFVGVDVHVTPELPAAEGPPELARRMLAPLVHNARRYARRRVRLDVSANERSVRVAVRDDGPGVATAETERVFEPGFQGDLLPGGAGLGLPLARRLAQSCGGDVTAAPGPGGRFELSLPRAGE
jgi:signal transduction histidine kinase